MSQRTTRGSSKRIRWSAGIQVGRRPTKALKPSDVQKEAANTRRRLQDQLSHLTDHDLAEYVDNPFAGNYDDDGGTGSTLKDVLDGRIALNISNAGGEFAAMLHATTPKHSKKRKRGLDGRTRRDRIERSNQGFNVQFSFLTDEFMRWQATVGKNGYEGTCPAPLESRPRSRAIELDVLDIFASFKYSAVILPDDVTVASCIVRHGIIPNSPFKPKYGVSIRALEVYRSIHLRCPHLALEPYIKGLYDIHGRPYSPSFHRHFSNCYDVYIRLKDEAQKRVDQALKRDQDQWRRRNACPACTYKLKDEPTLTFDMLVTMDGNDSLKRVLKRSDDVVEVDGLDGTARATYVSNERPDSRKVEGDYYLSREDVNKWARDAIHKALAEGTKLAEEGEEDATPCEGRWKNMDAESTARMWGVFDETGIFLCLCRHGFVLVVLDMVQSGELTKYPLAVVDALLDAFGDNIGAGYDIGCQFEGRLRNSPLGEKATKMNLKSLVGSFHGHAHNRLCQLSHLATYVEGLGLEDLEGCERFFSKSNALASALRYASIFHRKQKILEFIKHSDALDTSQNLSKFLVENYKQALEIISTEPAVLRKMKDHGITDPNIFTEWRKEEEDYLLSLSKEPVHETLQMDYYQKLVNFYDSEKKYKDLQHAFKTTWVAYDPLAENTATTSTSDNLKPTRVYKRQPHTQLKHAEENLHRCTEAVQTLEVTLGITERWTSASPDWEATRTLVNNRRYQRSLDELEALVVSRIFELTKMNMAQTGYKLRKHVANALKARSTAIRNALTRYNAAAQAMKPPRACLTWDTIVEYAFLADFDLLRDTHQDIRERKWAQPLMRTLMDQHSKIQRAREEILRLNVEIKRVVTHLVDEENFLRGLEVLITQTDAVLAHHIKLYRQQRTRFSALHLRRFSSLANRKHFTGSLDAGTSIDASLHTLPTNVFQPSMTVDTPRLQDELIIKHASAGGEGIEGEGDDGSAIPSNALADKDSSSDTDDSDDSNDSEDMAIADLDCRYQMLSLLGDR